MKAFKDGQGPRTHKNREIAILQRLIDKIYCPEVAKESPDKILTPKDIAEKIRAHINVCPVPKPTKKMIFLLTAHLGTRPNAAVCRSENSSLQEHFSK
jgi:hypothetical protein